MIRCLIIDDEELARVLLSNYVSRLPYLSLSGVCKNPLEAITHLQENPVDLLLLDIQMPELTGMEMLRILPNPPMVIFTTAYPQYALEGYELDVIDYLLKPFSFDRFVQAAQKVVERFKSRTTVVPEVDFILVKSEHRLHRLKLEEICFIEGMREYVAFHTRSAGKILSLLSLKQLETELTDSGFIRIHKSYIVAIREIQAMEGNQLIVGGTKLPVGASYREAVIQRCFR